MKFGEVLAAVAPVYLIIMLGGVLRKARVLKAEQDESVFRLVFSVLSPCLILDRILGSTSVRDPGTVFWGISMGFGLTVASFALTWYFARLLGLAAGQGRRTFTLGAGLQNFGYTAVPVAGQIWGAAAMPMLFVHNLGVELAIWSVGTMLMTGQNRVQWRRMINGPVLSVLAGLLLVATGVDRQAWLASGPLRTAMHQLGSGAFPIAILVTGAIITDLAGKEKLSLKIISGGCLMRLLVLPFFLLAAAKFLPLPRELKEVIVVQAAMPAAMTPIMLARLYGGVPGIAVQIVLATTVASLLTVPLAIVWGTAWLGL